jgi:hypothetical protein
MDNVQKCVSYKRRVLLDCSEVYLVLHFHLTRLQMENFLYAMTL